MKQQNKYVNLLLTIVVSMLIGAVLMMILGHNPIEAYYQLFRGAFVGKLNLGTTLQKFIPLLLTAMAFAVSSKVGVFNVGVEGELYLGALVAAWVGYNFVSVPGPIHMVMCFGAAIIVGACWAFIPGFLKSQWGVNEVCVTILMNYVAKYITSYFVNGPLSAGTGVPQTPTVADNVRLTQFLKPSQVSTGLFLAIALVIFLFWRLTRYTARNTTPASKKPATPLNTRSSACSVCKNSCGTTITTQAEAIAVTRRFGTRFSRRSPKAAW